MTTLKNNTYVISNDKIRKGDYILDIQNRIGKVINISTIKNKNSYVISYALGTFPEVYPMRESEINKIIATNNSSLNLPLVTIKQVQISEIKCVECDENIKECSCYHKQPISLDSLANIIKLNN